MPTLRQRRCRAAYIRFLSGFIQRECMIAREYGTGAYGKLPVMQEIKREAERRKVELVIVPTAAAIEELRGNTKGTNEILHVTC